MQGLQIDLGLRPDLHEPQRRAGNGFRNGFGVDGVRLVGLHIGLHELGRDDIMTERGQFACQPFRSGTASMPIKAVSAASKNLSSVSRENLAL